MALTGGQRLRLSVVGMDGATFEREPAEVSGRQPEVRPMIRQASDRALGLRAYEVTVDGWVLTVVVEPASRAELRQRAGQAAADRRRRASDVIRAQIPGRVVRLWVAEGDTVEAGQRLLAIEAMKMENEVRSPRAGTVGSIRVTAGSSVELGDELLAVR